jgi:hypothetical protein
MAGEAKLVTLIIEGTDYPRPFSLNFSLYITFAFHHQHFILYFFYLPHWFLLYFPPLTLLNL